MEPAATKRLAEIEDTPAQPAMAWLVSDDAGEANDVRRARMRTLPDSALLLAMAFAWNVGGPSFAVFVVRSWWAVAWLALSVATQIVRIWLNQRCQHAVTSPNEPTYGSLLMVNIVSFFLLSVGVFGLLRTAEPRLVAVAIVLSLGWMSYVASRFAAFPRMAAALLYLLGWTLAAGLLTSPTLWIIGLVAITFPVAYQVMMKQSHQIIASSLNAQYESRQLSMHDHLTGLGNRRALERWTDERVAGRQAGRGASRFAVLCLDLDGFKAVNDTFGHPAGDELLRQVATRLSTSVRRDDAVYRTGGDEFTILAGDADGHNAMELAGRIIKICSRPHAILGNQWTTIGVSVGIAVYPDDGDDLDTVVSRADAALYTAKQTGRCTRWNTPTPTARSEVNQIQRSQHSSH